MTCLCGKPHVRGTCANCLMQQDVSLGVSAWNQQRPNLLPSWPVYEVDVIDGRKA
jgi:hypothetical protein